MLRVYYAFNFYKLSSGDPLDIAWVDEEALRIM